MSNPAKIGGMTGRHQDSEQTSLASFEELRLRDCSIKRTLEIVGEKWTLLVIREALYGAVRFEEFLTNVGCPRAVLSERLATLVEHGALRREPYRIPGQRERYQYLLTEKGYDLFVPVVALMQWGDRWEAGAQGGPVVVRHRDCDELVHLELRCAHDHRCAVEDTFSGPRPG
jgi:DNA-binding HxlR family transcriptional regulator